MITPNKELAFTKSGDLDLTALLSGGLLPVATQRQFFVRLTEEPTLLKDLTMKPMGSYIENLPAIKFADYVLAPGEEGKVLDAGDTHVPTLSQPVLTAKLFKAKIPVTREALKDNVQGGTLLNLIMERAPGAIARDMERIIVRSDTAGGSPSVLKQISGVLAQVTSHTYDGQGAKINKDQLEGMFALLANEYKQDVSKLRYYTTIQAERAWRNKLADRQTPGGDRWLAEKTPAVYAGVDIKPCAGFMPYSSNGNLCDVLLCDPKNIVVGMWQDVELRIVEEPLASKFWILAYVRFDVKYQDEEAVVRGINVSVV